METDLTWENEYRINFESNLAGYKEELFLTNRRLFTSESVTEGHPDKICDQISDAILDAILAEDPNARVACETTVTTGLVLVAGEITTSTYVDIPKVVRQTMREIGYTLSIIGYVTEMSTIASISYATSPRTTP